MMNGSCFFSSSEKETIKLGACFALSFSSFPITIALHGELGSGKTTFIKGFIAALLKEKENDILSPTFSYLHIYGENPSIYHFDLYRLKDKNAFLSMGFSDYLHGEGICLIEWPERISPLLPQETVNIHLSHIDNVTRKIEIA